MPSAEVLGLRVDLLGKKQVKDLLLKNIQNKKQTFVITSNVEMYYQAVSDAELKNVINQADLNIPDSVGIVWALSRQNKKAELFPGVELTEWLLSLNKPTYLLGTRPEYLAKIPGNIVGRQDGFYKREDEAKIIAEIARLRPQILFVALGAGRQEKFIAKYRQQLGATILVGVGGALDVLSGAKERAPQLVRRLKLEWLYRLFKEPSRWRRQLNLLRFVLAVINTPSSAKGGHFPL